MHIPIGTIISRLGRFVCFSAHLQAERRLR